MSGGYALLIRWIIWIATVRTDDGVAVRDKNARLGMEIIRLPGAAAVRSPDACVEPGMAGMPPLSLGCRP